MSADLPTTVDTVAAAPGRARPSSENDLRASAREKVQRAAQRGQDLPGLFPAEDLAWAFHDRQTELDELLELAERVRAERDERQRVGEQNRQVRELADQIERGWERDRRHAAEAEARRRLGIEDPS